MDRHEYLFAASEANELRSLLAQLPEDDVLERIGLESRLQQAEARLSGTVLPELPKKARLTFRGEPVRGSYGIAADFAAKATSAFSEAVASVAAALSNRLNYMGPIPNRSETQLLITGTALGSFGFELELPDPPAPEEMSEPLCLEPPVDTTAIAMEKIERLFELAASGSDDDVAEVVDEIHPRAVKKAAEFLKYVAEQRAFCGLEFNERSFRFKDVDQTRASAERLESGNIKEDRVTFDGELQGLLPKGRTFEFRLQEDGKTILRGKVGPDIDDPDLLNRKFLHKLAKITLDMIQVGQGRPRYTLASIEDVQLV